MTANTTYANRPSASLMRRLIALAIAENEIKQYSRHNWQCFVTLLHTGDPSLAGPKMERLLKEGGAA